MSLTLLRLPTKKQCVSDFNLDPFSGCSEIEKTVCEAVNQAWCEMV